MFEYSRRSYISAAAVVFCAAGFLMLAQFLAAQAKASRPPVPGKKNPVKAAQPSATVSPSLDALVRRVGSYWSLLARNRRLAAMEYVESSDRQYFATRPFPSFSEPRLVKLEPSATGKVVAVTMSVKRIIPPLVAAVDYPVTNRWVFSGGNWWVVIKDEPLPMLSGVNDPRRPVLSTPEIERKKAALRARLTFPTDVIDIGTVRKGHVAEFVIPYRSSGDQPFEWRLRADSLNFLDSPESILKPGSDGQISLKLLTENLEGSLDEPLAVIVAQEGVEVEYDMKLRGLVYTPLSVVPSALRYRTGELEKELVIKNNSQSEARFASIYSESDAFEVKPLPQDLPPGGTVTFKVRQFLKETRRNYTEILSIKLASPVDGMESVLVPVVTNAEERKAKSYKDLTAKDIEEMIRKSRPNPNQP